MATTAPAGRDDTPEGRQMLRNKAARDYMAGRISLEEFAALNRRYAVDYGAATLTIARMGRGKD